jgi:hypothetical protein
LPFDSDNPPFGSNYAGPTIFQLGKISELREYVSLRHCPFCRFVVSTFDQYVFEEDINERDWRRDCEIKLCYSTSSGLLTLSVMNTPDVTRWIGVLRDSHSTNPLHKIRLARPMASTQVDIKMILGWLDACVRFHGEKCQSKTTDESGGFSTTPYLRVIDVLDLCIITAPSSCRYVTLSYVWGGVPMLKLTKENKYHLSQPGSLKENLIWGYIPQTIRDAITLTQQLGLRYLWVDSLCLVQDDEAELQSGISAMDLVYEESYVTIIAGAGTHAHFGLPGMRDHSRTVKQEVVEVIPGLQLAIVRPLDRQLDASEYSRRGWT